MRPILLLAAALFSSCIGSYEEAVEETRAGLIGKTGRELRACLGVPTDFDREGDVELLTYRWVFEPRSEANPGNGGMGGVVIGPRGGMGGIGDPRGFPRDPDEQAFCQLDFELDPTGVTKVTAVGRDEHGLRANSSCMMRARHCVDGDESYADDPDE